MIAELAKPIIYPSSDGQPMAENSIQYGLIVLFKENVDLIFAKDSTVWVAADNFIYPVEGQTRICQAPDVYVAFGRPKGDRASYKVWEEDGIFPQVVVEVLSPSNSGAAMASKFSFYERYGAEEYYIIDPDRAMLAGWLRKGQRLEEVPNMNGFVSPRLGVKFELVDDEFAFYRPNGTRFRNLQEVEDLAEAAEIDRKISDAAREIADQKAAVEKQRAEKSDREAERLRDLLMASGIDPGSPP